RDRTVTGVQTCALPISADAKCGGVESAHARRDEGDRDQRGTGEHELPATTGENRGAADDRMEEIAPDNEDDAEDPDSHRSGSREIGRASCREGGGLAVV